MYSQSYKQLHKLKISEQNDHCSFPRMTFALGD